jgi:YVTN family beta-propeller protein
MPAYSLGTDPNTVIGIVTDENPATFYEPYNLAISPNGQTIYVSNFGNNTVSIVDVATNTVTGIVSDPSSTFHGVYGISFSPNGQTAYVMNSDMPYSISIVDTATNTVTGTVNTTAAQLREPLYMAITADGTTGYVANADSGNVTVVDLTTNVTTQNITLPGTDNYVTNILIAPNGTTAYASTYYTGVFILDITNNTVTGSVSNGTFDYPYQMAITADGSTLYVSNFYGNTVSVVDTATGTQTATVTDLNPATFNEPYGMAISKDGTRLFVTNYSGNSVSIVDTATNAVTGLVTDLTPPTFDEPNTISIIPNGEYGYVPNTSNNEVSIIFISPLIGPPSNFTGCKSQDVFLFQEDLVNILSWNSPSGGTAPVSYKIYSNTGLTQLVATVSASGPLQYIDHNRAPNTPYSYYIVSVDAQSDVSSSVGVTVNQNCA